MTFEERIDQAWQAVSEHKRTCSFCAMPRPNVNETNCPEWLKLYDVYTNINQEKIDFEEAGNKETL